MKTSILKFVATIAVAATTATASAKYLYSMVENAKDIYNEDAPITFDYMTLSVISTSGEKTDLTFYDSEGKDFGAATAVSGTMSGYYSTPALYAYISDDPTLSTVLYELWSTSQDKRVGWQTFQLASIPSENIATERGGASPFVVSQIIPEPTSGLMLLFGLAGLALRRKRA